MFPPVRVPGDSALQTCPRDERPCGQAASETLRAHHLGEDPFSKTALLKPAKSQTRGLSAARGIGSLVIPQAPLEPPSQPGLPINIPVVGLAEHRGHLQRRDSCSCPATLLDARPPPHPAVLSTLGPFQPLRLAAAGAPELLQPGKETGEANTPGQGEASPAAA